MSSKTQGNQEQLRDSSTIRASSARAAAQAKQMRGYLKPRSSVSEEGGVLCEVKRPLSLWQFPHTVCLLDGYIPMFECPIPKRYLFDPCLDCVNQTMHGQSESYNGTPLRPSAHASMLPSWLLRLIRIVSVIVGGHINDKGVVMPSKRSHYDTIEEDAKIIIIIFMYGFTAMFYAILLLTIGKMEFKIVTTSYSSLKQFVSTSSSSLKRLFPFVGRVIKDIALIIRNIFSDLACTITIGMLKNIQWASRHDDRLQAACDDKRTVKKRSYQRKRTTDTCFMMKTARSYNGKKYPECPPCTTAPEGRHGILSAETSHRLCLYEISLMTPSKKPCTAQTLVVSDGLTNVILILLMQMKSGTKATSFASTVLAQCKPKGMHAATSTCSAISTGISQIHS